MKTPRTFENALAVRFADPNIGVEAIYTSDAGAPAVVRAVVRRPDEVTNFGDARFLSETTRVDLRVAEVPNPRPGDRIEIGGDAFSFRANLSGTGNGWCGPWI